MKKSMTFFGALIISCSAFGATQEADRMSLILVSQFSQDCPVEFAKATNKNKAIFSVTSVSSENGNYASKTVMITGYPAASLNSPAIPTNRVTIESKLSDGPAPSGVSRFEHSCKIESIK